MGSSDSISVPDWDVACKSWEPGASVSKAESDIPKNNHTNGISVSFKEDNCIAKGIYIGIGLIFHPQNIGKATLPFKFSYIHYYSHTLSHFMQ